MSSEAVNAVERAARVHNAAGRHGKLAREAAAAESASEASLGTRTAGRVTERVGDPLVSRGGWRGGGSG